MSARLSAVVGGAVSVGGAEMVGYACAFARNVILARALSQAEFGVASAFGMLLTVFEFVGAMSLSRLIVQDVNGDSAEFQATAHALQSAAAGVSALLLLGLSAPIMLLFGVASDGTAAILLAIVPLAKGVEHLDIARMERRLNFVPGAVCTALPQLLTTLMAWPVSVWMPDYRAVLLLLSLKGVSTTVLTHVVAERRYRWEFVPAHVGTMVAFGMPLLVNGLLLFAVFQGDQFIVARHYSMDALGGYAAAAFLALAPTQILGRVLVTTMLPVIAKEQHVPERFLDTYRLFRDAITLTSVAYVTSLIIPAGVWMSLAFGPAYRTSGDVLACLALVNALRTLRLGTATAALAKGDSINQMNANALRCLSLVAALFAASMNAPIWVIAMTGVAGESVAYVYSLVRLKVRDGVPMLDGTWAMAGIGIAAAAASAIAVQVGAVGDLVATTIGLSLAAAGACAGCVISGPLRRFFLARKVARGTQSCPL